MSVQLVCRSCGDTCLFADDAMVGGKPVDKWFADRGRTCRACLRSQPLLAADITSNYHRGNTESIAAHDSIKFQKQLLRDRVVGYVRDHGGATSDEVEQGLSLSHQTVSARLTEAKTLGVLVDSGRRRPTRSGRKAAVLVPS